MGLGGGSEAEKSFVVWKTWAFVVIISLHSPPHRDQDRPEFCEWSWKVGAREERLRLLLEEANLLAERCRVSNKQQWAGNRRYVIGCGEENLAGPEPEAPPLLLPWLPVRLQPPRRSLETVAQIRAAGLSQGIGRRGTLAAWLHSRKVPEPHRAGLEAGLRLNLSPAGVNVQFLLKILLGARLRTG